MKDDRVILYLHGLIDLSEDPLDDPAIFIAGAPLPGKRLQQHPHGAAILVHHHGALQGVGHILGAEASAFVKTDPLADFEGVGQPVWGDATVVQTGHLGGQDRDEPIGVGTVKEDQGLIDIPDPLGARDIIGAGGIHGAHGSVGGQDKGIRIFNRRPGELRAQEPQDNQTQKAYCLFHLLPPLKPLQKTTALRLFYSLETEFRRLYLLQFLDCLEKKLPY